MRSLHSKGRIVDALIYTPVLVMLLSKLSLRVLPRGSEQLCEELLEGVLNSCTKSEPNRSSQLLHIVGG